MALRYKCIYISVIYNYTQHTYVCHTLIQVRCIKIFPVKYTFTTFSIRKMYLRNDLLGWKGKMWRICSLNRIKHINRIQVLRSTEIAKEPDISYIYIHMHVYIYLFMYIYMSVCLYICMYIYIYIWISIYIFILYTWIKKTKPKFKFIFQKNTNGLIFLKIRLCLFTFLHNLWRIKYNTFFSIDAIVTIVDGVRSMLAHNHKFRNCICFMLDTNLTQYLLFLTTLVTDDIC